MDACQIHPSRMLEPQLLEQCVVRRSRHTGPGGQHRNKVETAIEIVHTPTGLTTFAAERRSQEANRQVAVFRLRVLLAVQLRCVRSTEVMPSDMWNARCRDAKILCSERHMDFPAMLAEAMDAIDAKEYDVRRAAAALGCSTSQLVRFVAKIPEALAEVNLQRSQRGLHRLQS
ncbi:MAG: peptide chain release factor family protein [Planctomycetota bacterium]